MSLPRICAKCGHYNCPGHARPRRLPSAAKRGYGAEYQRNKKIMVEHAWERKDPCWRCGMQFASKSRITADHKVPIKFGGGPELDNLRPAHFRCNAAAGGKIHGRLYLQHDHQNLFCRASGVAHSHATANHNRLGPLE